MKALLSQQHPFYQLKEDLQVFSAIARRELPTLPTSDSWSLQRKEAKKALWDVCSLCWSHEPASRADMSLIKLKLRNISLAVGRGGVSGDLEYEERLREWKRERDGRDETWRRESKRYWERRMERRREGVKEREEEWKRERERYWKMESARYWKRRMERRMNGVKEREREGLRVEG